MTKKFWLAVVLCVVPLIGSARPDVDDKLLLASWASAGDFRARFGFAFMENHTVAIEKVKSRVVDGDYARVDFVGSATIKNGRTYAWDCSFKFQWQAGWVFMPNAATCDTTTREIAAAPKPKPAPVMLPEVEPEENVIGAQPAPAATAPTGPNPFTLGSVWKGSYVCGQGTTDLVLKFDHVDGQQARGVFAFQVPGGGAKGSFKIWGAYDTRRSAVDFIAGEWVERPAGYTTVGLSGTVSGDGRVFSGTVKNPACSSFKVAKITEASTPAAAAPAAAPADCQAVVAHVLRLVDELGKKKGALGTAQFVRERDAIQKNVTTNCAKGIYDPTCIQGMSSIEALGACVVARP